LGVPRNGIADRICTIATTPKATRGPRVASAHPPASGPTIAASEASASRAPNLMAAVLGVAQRREIGVIARPIEGLADRSDHASREQHGADAVNLREQRKLQRDTSVPSATSGRSPHRLANTRTRGRTRNRPARMEARAARTAGVATPDLSRNTTKNALPAFIARA